MALSLPQTSTTSWTKSCATSSKRRISLKNDFGLLAQLRAFEVATERTAPLKEPPLDAASMVRTISAEEQAHRAAGKHPARKVRREIIEKLFD
ncbi:hypothetical protein MTBPR1_50148 [Candidatus Terasakiella magnetica]|uniref:Uncharacterized protein n=1 Tax=Candidatus Terasakiella magnetica TaxID=1867952 RepID=A0A1C3RJD3_9PROT|nr:hypothetical protein MTBPR1_50148 [Candidatus Terasakiella magnetica]